MLGQFELQNRNLYLSKMMGIHHTENFNIDLACSRKRSFLAGIIFCNQLYKKTYI